MLNNNNDVKIWNDDILRHNYKNKKINIWQISNRDVIIMTSQNYDNKYEIKINNYDNF